MLFYHVTNELNMDKINAEGIVPAIGENSRDLGEEIERIYLFNKAEDCDSALGSWLGDCFDEDDNLTIIEIEIPLNESHLSYDGEFYESHYYGTIPPSMFTRVMNEIEFGKLCRQLSM